jgi:diaminopimelate decarboxylase
MTLAEETPRYEYSRRILIETAKSLKDLSLPFGFVVRYAIKANPHQEVIKILNEIGIEFDASSSYEADFLIEQGLSPSKISLSTQQSAHNLAELVKAGVIYNATSKNQLQQFLELENHPKSVGVRINPGMGVGANNRTNTGGLNSSFGIWHEYADEIHEMTSAKGVIIDRVHIHAGSGADPSVWGEVIDTALEIMEHFPDATTLDIGGGFKVMRFEGEKEADMQAIIEAFALKLEEFAKLTGRELALEIEPGTFLVAHMGRLVASIDDIVDTGKDGYKFLRLNTGMNDFLRTTMYGAQHMIKILNDSTESEEYIVVGHNCESGDIFSTEVGDSETIKPRTLPKAQIGDEVVIEDVGAYSASMRAKGYNSFPDAKEIFVD